MDGAVSAETLISWDAEVPNPMKCTPARGVTEIGSWAENEKGFKEFLLQGNVVDLAVAVIIGAAFATVIKSFAEDMLTPLIAAFGGQPDFSATPPWPSSSPRPSSTISLSSR
jgi:hypothetical protein